MNEFAINLNIPVAVWVLLAVSLVAGCVVALWQWHRASVLTKHVKHSAETAVAAQSADAASGESSAQPTAAGGEQPLGVSVVVDARNELTELRQCLPRILHQDYSPFEVVAVVGDQNEAASETLSQLRAQFVNLSVTYVTRDTRGLSRKKLALLLGIKAAKYPVILTTNANCRPASEQWLSLMMSKFTPDIDVVLGYSHYRYNRDRGIGRFYRVFDTVTEGTTWLVSALTGHPYRGTCDNLAYRKQLFDDHKGFANSLHLQWGDDDVWVSEVASPTNTAVQLLPDSQLHAHYDNTSHAHTVLKMRRDFTSRRVRRMPRVVQALMSLLAWIHVLAAGIAIAMMPTNAIVVAAAALSLLVPWTVLTAAVRRQCVALGAPKPIFTVPLFTLWRPIVNCGYCLYEWPNRYVNYTNHI